MSSLPNHLLLEMIRADLELAFEHASNGQIGFALHEVGNAREKLLQMAQAGLANSPEQSELNIGPSGSDPLLTLSTPTTNDQTIPGTGTDSPIHN